MKVLLLSPLPPPAGGITTWTKNVLDFYADDGHEYTLNHQDTAIRLKKITRVDLFSRWYYGTKGFIKIWSELKRNIAKFKPDVIHLASSASLALLKDYAILQYARKQRIPVITHWRFGRIPKLAQNKNWEWFLLIKVIRKSYTSIVLDHNSLRCLNDAGLDNVVEIPNPIGSDVERLVYGEKGKRAIKNRGSVLFAGHIIRNKGVYELVETCADLEEVRELTLVGTYEKETGIDLTELAKIRGDENWLKMPGELNKSEVLELMRKTELCVLPSYTEGFPNAVVEALSMGIPVIATNVGAIPDILAINTERSCGVCVPVKQIEALKLEIQTMLRDTKKAKRMGQNGRERVMGNYTMEKVMGKYLSVWKNVKS